METASPSLVILVPPTTDSFDNTVKHTRNALAEPADFDGRDALPVGTRLAEFEVLCVLGTGGFGIVYLALDHALLRQVAIKEYMPSSLAVRGAGAWVELRAPQHAETFAAGLKSFVNEAQLLASFDNPSLLKVHRFWEDQGTAYMVMQYYPGLTLKQQRSSQESVPTEAWLRALVEPLLDGLELLHHEGVYHRDISPDNILLQVDGPPVLLDFGAARRVITDRTQTLTAILKPSFAPVEQYANIDGMRQGPWTDLYSVAAVLYFMIRRQPPVPAVARAVRDSQRPLAAEPGELSVSFLEAIDWALAVAPEDRPQNVGQFRAALHGKLKRPTATVAAPPRPRHPLWPVSAGVAVGVFAAVLMSGAHFMATSAGKARGPQETVAMAVVAAAPAAPAASDAAASVKVSAPRARPDKPVKAAAAKSPDDVCGSLGFFRKQFCVSRECASSRFKQHPQCVALRNQFDERQRNYGS